MVALRKCHLKGDMAKEDNPLLGLEVLEVLLGSRRLGKGCWRRESQQEQGETPAGLQLCCHRAARVSGSQQCPARTRGLAARAGLSPAPGQTWSLSAAC